MTALQHVHEGEPPRLSAPLVAVLTTIMIVGGAVLRLWHIGGTTFIWDETLDGVVARMPVRALASFLRSSDVHPPLEYLLRAPIARHTDAEWPMRLPSALASIAALVGVAVLLRRHQRFALVATGLAAVSAFQLFYAWEARPYAVLALVGVGAAVLTDRWLREPTDRGAIAVGCLVAFAMLYHESGALLVPGLVAAAGLRRDPRAWTWRACVAGGACVWAVVWGPAFIDQLSTSRTLASYVPMTSVDSLTQTVKETVHYQAVLPLGTTLLVLAGGLALRSIDRELSRTWLCLFAVPLISVALVGTRAHVVWSKTFAVCSWGSLVAVAAAVEWLCRRWTAFGLVAVVAAAVLMLPSTVEVLRHPQFNYAPPWAAQVRTIERHARPGDAVAADVVMQYPLRWYVGLDASPAPESIRARWASVFLVPPGPWNGRVWTLDLDGQARLLDCPQPSPEHSFVSSRGEVPWRRCRTS